LDEAIVRLLNNVLDMVPVLIDFSPTVTLIAATVIDNIDGANLAINDLDLVLS
jgi:hypothetical protein